MLQRFLRFLRIGLSVAVVGAAAVACAVDLTPLGPVGELVLPTELVNKPVFLPPPVRGEGFVLIDGVRPLTIVTVNKKVRSGLWALGDELKYHLEEMSGETVSLVEPKDRPAEGPVVVIGADDGTVAEGTSIVRWDGKDELYIGGEGAGISHALTYVLEALGCRYLFPGKAGKIIPKKKRVVLPNFELNYTPPFKVRLVKTPTVGNSSVNEGLKGLGIDPTELSVALKESVYDRTGNRSFWSWHGVNDATVVGTDVKPYSEVVRAGHHFTNYWDLYKDEHPEWFALQPDDTREQTSSSPRLCTSNKALRDNIVGECVGRLDANPDRLGLSICMPDGSYDSVCFCEECRRLDPPNGAKISGSLYKPSKHPYEYVALSDRMLDFSNYVMEEVRKLRPGRHLVQFCYSSYVAPPVLLRPDPDLVFFNVSGNYTTEAKMQDARKNLAGWLSFGNDVVWRPNVLENFQCYYPMNFGRKIFEDVEAIKPNGAVGVSFDCCNADYASCGFMFYMLAKSVLNPDHLDYDTIAADWLASGFGAAADRIGDYVRKLERLFDAAARRAIGTRGYIEAFDVGEVSSLLDAAEAAAGGDANVLERIAYLRVGVAHAREMKKVYFAWASRDASALTAARADYRAWIAEEGLRHPFEFPHTCSYMSGDTYDPATDGELLTGGDPRDLILTDDKTVFVPAGTTNFYENLRGAAFTLTKTGGGVLQIGHVATTNVSVVVEEGAVEVTNRRPAAFADAFFHVDASAADTLVIDTRDGTNFVTRWNDADGRGRYAGPLSASRCGRTDPTNRLPFVSAKLLGTHPYLDFGSLIVPGYTNESGVAIGWGGALAWSEPCTAMRQGFTVVSDTPDVEELTNRYANASSYSPMSFFSQAEHTTGYRGSFSSSHYLWLYADNAGNYPFTRGTNYLDGVRTTCKRSFPSGFHLLDSTTDENVTVDSFGAEYWSRNGTKYMYGGTRIAEHCVFTNALDELDRLDVTRYLQAKWFPQTIPSVTVKAGARFAADADSTLSVGRFIDASGCEYVSGEGLWMEGPCGNLKLTGSLDVFVPAGATASVDILDGGAHTLTKRGGGTLVVRIVKDKATEVVVEEGEVAFRQPPRPDEVFANAYLHLDASDASTLVTETVNGTNFVVRWNDADGRAICATNTPEERAWRPDPENRRAFLSFDKTDVGLPVVDLGEPMFSAETNELGVASGYGAALQFAPRKTMVCEEFFTVTEDNEAVKAAPAGLGGPSFLGNSNGEMHARRGNTVKGSAPSLFTYYSSNAGSKYCYFGTNALDGVNVSSDTRFPDGFHVVNSRPTATLYANSLGRNYRNSGATCDTFGGLRYAEVLILSNRLDDVVRTNVNLYLMAKWQMQRLTSVTVKSGARMSVEKGYNLEIADYVQEEGSDINVPSGYGLTLDTIGSLDIYGHFDAADAASLEIRKENGTNFVMRWNSQNDGALFATNYGITAELGDYRPDPENRLAFLAAAASETGLPAVDFGSFLSYRTASGSGDTTGAEGYGAAMVWSKTGGAPVREFIIVAADDTTRTWPTHSSTRCIRSYLGTVSNTGNGFRGNSGKLFDLWDSLAGTKATSVNADIRLDGVSVSYTNACKDGAFHVIDNLADGAVSCDAFAYQRRNKTNESFGGIRIGEFIGLRTAIADELVRARVNAHLMHKWLGTEKAVRTYRRLEIPDGAFMEVVTEDVAVTNLMLGGVLTAGRVVVANLDLTAAGAEIDGILDLGTRPGTLTVSIADAGAFAGRTVRLLGFRSVCGSLDGWTVENRTGERAVITLKEDGIYGKFGKTGFLILVQ